MAAHVRCVLGHRNAAISRITVTDVRAAHRLAHFEGYGEVQTAVRRYESIAYGERIQGPVIIETPVTTVVVPPDADVVMLPSGSLSMEFRTAAATSAEVVPLRSRA